MLGVYRLLQKKNNQRGDSLSYLGYKINQQKNQPQKVQICKDQLQTLNDFQKLMGNINWLWPTTRLTRQVTYFNHYK